jgi:hypothetical protein
MPSNSILGAVNPMPSALPSGSRPGLPAADEFTKVTMLLCLANIINNKNGDTCMHDFPDYGGSSPNGRPMVPKSEVTMLNAINAILVQGKGTIATFYCKPPNIDVTVVESNRISDLSLYEV